MAESGATKFLDSLAKGKSVPAVVLLGSDAYLRDACRNKLIQTYVPENLRDWAFVRASAGDGLDDILGRAQTLPMLASRQVVLVEDLERIEDLGDEARESAVEQISAYLDDPAPFTVLVLEASGLDKRQKLYKVLAEKALLVSLEVTPEEAFMLAQQMAKEFGMELDRAAAAMLVDILCGEPARIRIELEKLSLYALDRGRITTADVEALVVSVRKFTVWQMADMLVDGNRDGALKLLDNLLREGEQPAGIVGALAWRYRNLIEGRQLPPRTWVYQAARQSGAVPDASARQLRKIPKQQLLGGIRLLAEADSQLKSGIPNPRAAMEFLLARLSGPIQA